MIQDPYKVLGVSPDASDDEIKQAYRRLAKRYHPDRNPDDPTAAKKMQEVNAAYEQIKNPEKAQNTSGHNGYGGYGSYGGFGGYGPFGGHQRAYSSESTEDNYQKAAYQYIRYRRYQEALNALENSTERNARWYFLSALANDALGNQVTALEHIKRAVSMEPDNQEYLFALNQIEQGGTAYHQHAGSYRSYTMRGNPCASLCLCWFFQFFCCRC